MLEVSTYVSETDFLVLLCRLGTKILAARFREAQDMRVRSGHQPTKGGKQRRSRNLVVGVGGLLTDA